MQIQINDWHKEGHMLDPFSFPPSDLDQKKKAAGYFFKNIFQKLN